MVCPLRYVVLLVSVVIATIGLWYSYFYDNEDEMSPPEIEDEHLADSEKKRNRWNTKESDEGAAVRNMVSGH